MDSDSPLFSSFDRLESDPIRPLPWLSLNTVSDNKLSIRLVDPIQSQTSSVSEESHLRSFESLGLAAELLTYSDDEESVIMSTISQHPGGNEETVLPWLQKQGRKIYGAVTEFEPIAWNVNLGEKGFIVLETATIELPDIVPHKGPAPWDEGAMDFLRK